MRSSRQGVLDASVLVAALVSTEANGRWADEQLVTFALAAPHLLLVETSNSLRRAVRIGELHEAEAAEAHQQASELRIELYPFAPFAERVWQLRADVSAYDAWYVALAETLGVPLLTLDARLARAPGLRCEVLTPA